MSTNTPKVYKTDGLNGGDEIVVASGGKITVKSGGIIDVLTGGIVKSNGTQVATIAALTDETTGTANDTVADVGGSFTQATLNSNFADLTAKINAVIAALKSAGIVASS